MSENQSIDLSKLSVGDYESILVRIKTGTPVGTMIAIGAALIAFILFISAIALKFDKYFNPSEVINSPHIKQVAEVKQSGTQQVDLDIEKINLKDREIEGLKNKNHLLQEQLDKLPNYIVCSNYRDDLRKLRAKKEETEIYIQRLLNPQVSIEQAQQGIYYSTVQLEIFVKQAAEYRKKADDIQREILAVELNSRECKE